MLWVIKSLRRESSGVWCEEGLNALDFTLEGFTIRLCGKPHGETL